MRNEYNFEKAVKNPYMTIKRFDHIAIYVRDIEATIQFYADILGMEVERNGDFAVLKFGKQKINVHPGRDETFLVAKKPDFGTADFCLVAEGDIHTIYNELKQREQLLNQSPRPGWQSS
jgi:catechol 2,3-dioxygenase-like lactoylglutathione lyase family enzyme